MIVPVVDYAVSRPDVDRDRLALWGISLGGYIAPRGGAGANLTERELQEWLRSDPEEFNDAICGAMARDVCV